MQSHTRMLSVTFTLGAAMLSGTVREHAPRPFALGYQFVGGYVSELRSGREEPLRQTKDQSNAASIVQHLRGSPGPFSSVDREIDRRLRQMTTR
jgi:hypothetical protein